MNGQIQRSVKPSRGREINDNLINDARGKAITQFNEKPHHSIRTTAWEFEDRQLFQVSSVANIKPWRSIYAYRTSYDTVSKSSEIDENGLLDPVRFETG